MTKNEKVYGCIGINLSKICKLIEIIEENDSKQFSEYADQTYQKDKMKGECLDRVSLFCKESLSVYYLYINVNENTFGSQNRLYIIDAFSKKKKKKKTSITFKNHF